MRIEKYFRFRVIVWSYDYGLVENWESCKYTKEKYDIRGASND